MNSLLFAAALAALALLLACIWRNENDWIRLVFFFCQRPIERGAIELEPTAELDTVQFVGGRRMTIGGREDENDSYDDDDGEEASADDENDGEPLTARRERHSRRAPATPATPALQREDVNAAGLADSEDEASHLVT